MFDNLLANPELFITEWYRWGVAIAFAVTFVVTLWIFYDSQSKNYAAPLWRSLSLLAVLVVLPGAVLAFFPQLAQELDDLPALLAYAGFAASLLSLLALAFYTVGIGVKDLNPSVSDEDYDLLPTIEEPTPEKRPSDLAPPPTPLPSTQSAEGPQREAGELLSAVDSEPLGPMAWLVLMNGHRAGQEFRLRELNDIGRDGKHNEISVDDPAMSRQHARVRLEKGVFVIYDLASSNGILVNQIAAQRQPLKNGDRIVVGQSEFGFMVVQEEEKVGAQADRVEDEAAEL